MQENSLSAVAAAAAAAVATPTTTANGIDQAQFEADKRAVYKHPLFSLLALLLEKCEQATQGYVSASSTASSPNGSSTNGNCEANDSFSRDIQAFVHLLEKEKRPLLTNNAELDGLMIKALQVLRIHLLELEKVQELCRDFCTRYIACLRGKMQSENLLRADYPLEHNNNLSNSSSPVNSPEQDHMHTSSQQGAFNLQTSSSTVASLLDNGSSELPPSSGHSLNASSVSQQSTSQSGSPPHHSGGNAAAAPPPPPLSSSLMPTQSPLNSSSATVGLLSSAAIATHQHLQHQQQHQQHQQQQQQQQQQQHLHQQSSALVASQILGSTPLSQIGCPPLTLEQYTGQLSPCGSSDEMDSEIDSNTDDLGSNFSNNSGSKRQKRGILPKHATSVMRAWLFQHLVHPYPTEDEKRAIAAQTNLTLLQVNNWFINARRRILQPMLEHANDSNGSAASRKKSSQSPSKRFWPENLSTSASLIDPNIENISANINRAESAAERMIAATHKLAEAYYSSDESNDSLVIDQTN